MGEKGALGEREAHGGAFSSIADGFTREKRRKRLLDNSGKDIFTAVPDGPQQAASEESLSFTERETRKDDPAPREPLCGSALGCTYSRREPSSSGRCHLRQQSTQDGEKLKEAANIPRRSLSGSTVGDDGGAHFSPCVCPSASCSSSASLLPRSTVLRGSSLSPHSLPSSFLAVSLSPLFPPKRSSSSLAPSSSSDSSSLSSTALVLSGPSSLSLCFPSSSPLPSCLPASPFSVSVALPASVSPAPHAPAVSHSRYIERQTRGQAAAGEHGARLTRVAFLRSSRLSWRSLSRVRKAAERKCRVEGRAPAASKTRQIGRGFCRSLRVSRTLWLFVLLHLLSLVCEGFSRSETDSRRLLLEAKKLAADFAPSLPRAHLPLPSPLAESSHHRKLASESSPSSSSPSSSSPSSSPSSPSSSPSLGSRAMSFLLGRGSENAQKTDGQKGDSVSPSSPETRDASSPSPSPAAAAQDAPPPAGMSLGASEKASSSGTKGEASGAQKDPTKTQTAATRPEPESPPTPATPPAANSKGHFFFGVDRPDRGKGEAGGVEREGGEKGSKSREEPPPPVFRVSSTSPSNAAVFVPAVFQQNSGEGNHVTLTIPLEVLPSLAAAGETATPPPDEKLASQGSDKERLTLSSLQWLPARESGAREREGETSVLHVGEKRRRGVHAQVGASGDEAPETSPASLEELSSNEREMVLSAGLLTLLLVLSVSLVLSHVSRKCHLRWLQMPVAATLLGLLVGAVLKFGLQVQGPILGSVLAMNEDVFFVMLLPPIIFEGGLSLSEGSLSKPFMRNFGAIMWLACFCTILSFCWVGTLMFFGGVLGLSMFLTVRQAFAFGALISSTDPVSVLALFKELHAKKLIHVLVFGESLLNDAISIVLYRTIASEDTASVGSAILAFFLTFFVSLVIGLAVGLFCALTYKYMDLHKEENQTLESALLLLFPWMAYLVADGLGYSGIVAICFCGVTIGKYAVPNLSASARTTSRSVFNSFSLLAETVVFAFLGLAVFSFDQPLHDELAVGLYVLGFVATFSARAISVFVTCTLINLFRTNAKITPQQQLALVLCGLRGAIAFALSERARRDFGGKEGAALLSLTLFLALFTILVLGPSLVFILDRLGIFEKHVPHRSSSPLEGSRVGRLDSDVELMRTSSQSTADFSLPGFSSARRRDCVRRERREEDSDVDDMTRGTCGGLKRLLLHLDRRFMIPLLTHSDSRHGASARFAGARFPSFFRDLQRESLSSSSASSSSVFSSFPGLSKSKTSPGSAPSPSSRDSRRGFFTSPAYMRVPTFASTSSLPGFPGEKRESGLSWDDLRRSLGVHTPEGLRRQQGERGAREVAMTALPPEGRQASRLRAEASGETEERKPSGRVSARRGAKGGDTDDEDAAGFSAPGLERDEMRGQERREDERSREGARGRGERETGLEDPFTEEDFDDVRVALPNAPRASGLRSDSEDQEFHSEEESWTEHIEPFSATPESLPVVVGRGDARRDSISEEMRVRGPEKACAQGYEMQNGWQTNGRENGVENEADARESIVGKRQVL